MNASSSEYYRSLSARLEREGEGGSVLVEPKLDGVDVELAFDRDGGLESAERVPEVVELLRRDGILMPCDAAVHAELVRSELRFLQQKQGPDCLWVVPGAANAPALASAIGADGRERCVRRVPQKQMRVDAVLRHLRKLDAQCEEDGDAVQEGVAVVVRTGDGSHGRLSVRPWSYVARATAAFSQLSRALEHSSTMEELHAAVETCARSDLQLHCDVQRAFLRLVTRVRMAHGAGAPGDERWLRDALAKMHRESKKTLGQV